MSRVTVQPAELEAAARSCEEGARVVAGVLGTLRGVPAPDTGRGDTRAGVDATRAALLRALEGLGVVLTADAASLRSAAATYRATDACAVPGGQG